ncbi:MAG: hypothetical protein U0791_07655 [Gemmataceae bacterium]
MKIVRLTSEVRRIPIAVAERIPLTGPKPVATALDLLLVHLETDAKLAGLGFTYANGPGAAAVQSLIETELSPLAVGEDPRDTDRLFAKAEARFRSVGFAGLAARRGPPSTSPSGM